MSLNDPISDMIARIKNGLMRAKTKIEMPSSNYKIKILEVLKSEGFIINFSLTDSANNKQNLLIDLKYHSGSPVINNIERISKPGRRVYASATSLPKINNGLGIAILSTSKGVITDKEARKLKIGGEVLCYVY